MLLYLYCFKGQVKSRKSPQAIYMYYVKTVDLTPEARKRRSHEIPGKDANTPSEKLTEVGNQRLYKNATTKERHLYMKDYFEVHVDFKVDFLECMDALNTRTLPFLKHTLAETQCTLQVDFTETYMCHFMEEISSMYYSNDQVKASCGDAL